MQPVLILFTQNHPLHHCFLPIRLGVSVFISKPLRPISVAWLLSGVEPVLENGPSDSVTQLNNICFLSLKCDQMPLAPQLVVEISWSPPCFRAWILSGLCLLRSCKCCHNDCESICALLCCVYKILCPWSNLSLPAITISLTTTFEKITGPLGQDSPMYVLLRIEYYILYYSWHS